MRDGVILQPAIGSLLPKKHATHALSELDVQDNTVTKPVWDFLAHRGGWLVVSCSI